MAATTSIKPFSPEETRRILDHLQQPAIFLNMTGGWPVLHWTAERLAECLGNKLIRFRLGRKEETNTPLFETQCSYVEAKVAQFLSWTQGQPGKDVGPFSEYSHSEYWAYADYKYIAMLFQDQPSMFEDVQWSEFGFEGRNGRESTLWIGTEGANTPCHLDSYGCNLVLQVQGRKRWHLFPPEDTAKLYPTRVPYEESSVFSQVDVLHPDLRRFPAFQGARAHVVTLQPGQVKARHFPSCPEAMHTLESSCEAWLQQLQLPPRSYDINVAFFVKMSEKLRTRTKVLYVPRHWWHYVESVDPVTVSVNSWIELEMDDVARVSEAVAKTVVFAIKSARSDDNTDNWLNPTEEGKGSHDENMQYVNLAMRACAQRQLNWSPRDTCPVKRDSSGQIKNRAPFSVPFGPHLIPVCCQQEELRTTAKHPDVSSSRNCTADSDTESRSTSIVKLHKGKHECSSGLTQSGPCDCASEHSIEDYKESKHTTITTNDLLDCLVHPDIITRVTELLLERHTGSRRNTTPL